MLCPSALNSLMRVLALVLLVSLTSAVSVIGLPLRSAFRIMSLFVFMVVWLRLVLLFSFSAFSHFRGKP